MDASSIIETLRTAVPGASYEAGGSVDFATIYVPAASLVETCRALRDTPSLRFNVLIEVTAADYLPREPRFEVVYVLVSIEHKLRMRMKVRLHGSDAHLTTVTGVWPAANWLEREVWDLFGIVFDGHPDPRRLLMPEDWDGFPLRKDSPVQIRRPPHVAEALQVTQDEFAASVERDRLTRRG
jgi:NADH-quinone oxidoreductase subunit C